MNDSNPADRTAWFRDVHAILDIAEEHPGMPLPRIYPGLAVFHFAGIGTPDERPEAVRTAEDALTGAFGCRFTSGGRSDGWRDFAVLTARLPSSGLRVDLVALVADTGAQVPELAGTAA